MKHLIFTILAIIGFSGSIHAQEWVWANGEGGKGMERSWDLAIDIDGSIYATGQFTDTLIIADNTIPSQGMSDIFVVKYSSQGKLEWVKTFGGEGEDIGIGIDCDNSGSCYISGYFTDTMVVGNDIYAAVGWDIFIIKLDSEGDLLWSKHPSCNGSEVGYGIAVNNSSDAYVTGWFQDTIYFTEENYIPSFGSSDIFIAKYDEQGNFLWARNAGNESVDYGYKIDTDNMDNCYLTGHASNGCQFGSLTLENGGMYVAKYSASGEALAVTSASGGVGSINISVAPDGNGFVAGRLTGSGIFHSLGDSIYSFEGSDDAYIAKFNSECNWQWIDHIYSEGTDKSKAVYANSNGDAFLVGRFNGELLIDDTTLVSESDDIFIAKLNPSGDYEWVAQGGGIDTDVPTDIIASESNNCYITGWFSGETQFGDIQLTASNNSDMNFFLASLDQPMNIEKLQYPILHSRVKPNPVFEKGTIIIDGNFEIKEPVHLVITNELGEKIEDCMISRIPPDGISVDASYLNSGIFFYKIELRDYKIEGKFIVLH